MIVIKGFPLPPSVNHMLIPSRGRLIHNSLSRQWKRTYQQWYMANVSLCQEIERDYKDKLLQVDTYFAFKRERLIGKKNQTKALDANNRVKPALDAFSFCFSIDDKFITSSVCEKIIATTLEQTIFVIQTRQEIITDQTLIDTLAKI